MHSLEGKLIWKTFKIIKKYSFSVHCSFLSWLNWWLWIVCGSLNSYSKVFCYRLVQFLERIGSCTFSNLNFFFEKYSSWERIGSCIFSNLHFFFGKYSSWEKIGSCKEVQFLGENGDSLVMVQTRSFNRTGTLNRVNLGH